MTDKAKRLRTAVLANCTKLQNYVNAFKSKKGTVEQLKVRLEQLEKYFRDYGIYQEVIESAEGVDIEVENKRSSDFEDAYLELKADILMLINRMSGTVMSQNIPETSADTHSQDTHTGNESIRDTVKLPFVKIESFSGEYRKWGTFRDLFNSMIHENDKLSKVTKLLYLKSYLTGKAARQIESLETTEANYTVAYDIIFKKYEDKKLIIQDHLTELMKVRQCKREAVVDLNNLIDEFQTHVRALKSLGVPVEHWDVILIHILANKLDIETRKIWETAASRIDTPTFEDIIDCVKNRCKVLETVSQITTYNKVETAMNRGNVKQIKSFLTTSRTICSNCQGNHYIMKCNEFCKLPTQGRVDRIKKLGLCFNCLSKEHLAQQCTSHACQKCGRKHHTLLHFEKLTTGTTTEESTARQSTLRPTSEEFVPNQLETVTLSSVVHQRDSSRKSQILLATVRLWVHDSFGNKINCRALLDSGS